MQDLTVVVDFAEHIALDQVAGMVSGMAAYGNVDPVAGERRFAVQVFRPSKLKGLTRQLENWERYGFLQWRRGA